MANKLILTRKLATVWCATLCSAFIPAGAIAGTGSAETLLQVFQQAQQETQDSKNKPVQTGQAQDKTTPPAPVIQLPVPPLPQAPEPEDIAVIPTDVKLIHLRVSVSDKFGNAYINLKQENFAVEMNKHRQEVKYFTRKEFPVSFIFVFDITGSMAQQWKTKVGRTSANFGLARQIMIQLLKGPLDQDEFTLFLVKDASDAELKQAEIREWTTDTARLQNTLLDMKPKGQTPLYATIERASEAAKTAHNEKKVMVVLTDGEENKNTPDMKKLKHDFLEKGIQLFFVIVPGTIRQYSVNCLDPNTKTKMPGMGVVTDENGTAGMEQQIQQQRICAHTVNSTARQDSNFPDLNTGMRGGPATGGPPISDGGPHLGCIQPPTLSANGLYEFCDQGPQGLAMAEDFTEKTGGIVFDAGVNEISGTCGARQAPGLNQALEAIYVHTRKQYVLGFYPQKIKKNDWNKVKVKIVNEKTALPNGCVPEGGLKPHAVAEIHDTN